MFTTNRHVSRAWLLVGCFGLLAGCDGPAGINYDPDRDSWSDEDSGTSGAGTETEEAGEPGEGSESGEGHAEEGTIGDPENAADGGGPGNGGDETG